MRNYHGYYTPIAFLERFIFILFILGFNMPCHYLWHRFARMLVYVYVGMFEYIAVYQLQGTYTLTSSIQIGSDVQLGFSRQSVLKLIIYEREETPGSAQISLCKHVQPGNLGKRAAFRDSRESQYFKKYGRCLPQNVN